MIKTTSSPLENSIQEASQLLVDLYVVGLEVGYLDSGDAMTHISTRGGHYYRIFVEEIEARENDGMYATNGIIN